MITTQAAVLWKSGADWKIEDVMLDEPRRGEVLVRVAAAGLCHSEEHHVTGDVPFAAPMIGGHEGAGYVDVWRAAFAPSEGAHATQAQGPWSGATSRRFERSAHIERWWHLGEWRAEWRGGLRFSFTEGSPEGFERTGQTPAILRQIAIIEHVTFTRHG